MDFTKRDIIVYIIGGHARNGKDTTANYIKEYYENIGKKVINLQFSRYIKDYAKCITNWDGKEETKPRELLQYLGTELIRNKIDNFFFINRVIEDIKVYSYFFDIVTISDARLVEEFERIKSSFENVYSIKVIRLNYESEMTAKQQRHSTEKALDNYNNFDYVISASTLEELKRKVLEMLGEQS